MKITDHVWRPPLGSRIERAARGPILQRACIFMNCQRPLSEHTRARMPRGQRASIREQRREAAGRCVA